MRVALGVGGQVQQVGSGVDLRMFVSSISSDRHAPIARGSCLALPFGTGQVHQIELADSNVITPVVALAALHHDAEDRVTS